MTRLIRRHGTAVFIALTFALSWPLWLLSGALGRPNVRTPDFAWLVAQVGVFAPAFAGMIVAAWSEAGAARRARRTLALVYLPAVALGALIVTRGFASLAEIGPRWTAVLVAFAAWVLFHFARGGNRLVPWPDAPARARTVAVWTVGSALGFAGVAWLSWLLAADSGAGPAPIAGVPVSRFTAGAIVTSLAVNLLYGGSLGEEPGWRGVWLPRLLRTRAPFEASLIISFWWALWHAPIDLTSDPRWGGVGAVLLRQVWTLPVTVLFTWLTIRGGGSLLVPIAVHTTLNAMPDFALCDPARYQRSIGILLLLMALVAVVALFTDRRLRPRPDPPEEPRCEQQ